MKPLLFLLNILMHLKNLLNSLDMPLDIAMVMHKPYFESKMDGVQEVLLDDDKECHKKKINDQVDFNDKKKSRLNDEIIARLV